MAQVETAKAKAVFQQVVQDQCATLVAEGHARDTAVQMLLARICEGRSDRPSEEAISAVVSSHPINRLDAQHALVVKQEIGACMRCAPLSPPTTARAPGTAPRARPRRFAAVKSGLLQFSRHSAPHKDPPPRALWLPLLTPNPPPARYPRAVPHLSCAPLPTGRLREQGYNVVAAIEEMTAKLQGLATGVGQSSAGADDGGAETARSASSAAAAAAADDEGGVGTDTARKRPLAAAPSGGAPSAKKAKKPAAASAASKSAQPKSPSSPKNKRKTTTTATAASSNTKTAGAGGAAAAGMQKRARHSRVKS
jgi:hypothetical protein